MGRVSRAGGNPVHLRKKPDAVRQNPLGAPGSPPQFIPAKAGTGNAVERAERNTTPYSLLTASEASLALSATSAWRRRKAAIAHQRVDRRVTAAEGAIPGAVSVPP